MYTKSLTKICNSEARVVKMRISYLLYVSSLISIVLLGRFVNLMKCTYWFFNYLMQGPDRWRCYKQIIIKKFGALLPISFGVTS